MKLIIQSAKVGLDEADEQIIEVGDDYRIIVRGNTYDMDTGWHERVLGRTESFDEGTFLDVKNRCSECKGRGYYMHILKGHLETCHVCKGTGKARLDEPGSPYGQHPRNESSREEQG